MASLILGVHYKIEFTLLIITHTAFRHCRELSYASFGQPVTETALWTFKKGGVELTTVREDVNPKHRLVLINTNSQD